MENVLIKKNGKIGIVTVNRPQQMNSMNSLTRSELAEAFKLLASLLKSKNDNLVCNPQIQL